MGQVINVSDICHLVYMSLFCLQKRSLSSCAAFFLFGIMKK